MSRHAYILGAGVSGLVTAWKLLERGWEVDVFEREPFYDGMARTWKWREFLLDVGPHLLIVEARMRSTRLPGNVLLPAAGKPMLELMIERLQRMDPPSGVIVATTVHPDDDPIEELAGRIGVGCFRGSEDDVLGRVVAAAQQFGTDIIVEITGDDPLLDPHESSRVVQTYLDRREDVDYVANDLEDTYPIRAQHARLQSFFARTRRTFDRPPCEQRTRRKLHLQTTGRVPPAERGSRRTVPPYRHPPDDGRAFRLRTDTGRVRGAASAQPGFHGPRRLRAPRPASGDSGRQPRRRSGRTPLSEVL